jgi:DMSO/TMAO reductase YedYZ molybdopterin-dependent catalytic subunit
MTELSQALHRRSFLVQGTLQTAALALGAGVTARGWAEEAAQPQLLVRQQNPVNLEFPFGSLQDFITPNELFYVRNHFPEPEMNVQTWRLRVEGQVDRPLQLSLQELRGLPSRRVTFTLECAGNSRALLDPPGQGVPWQQGAVSTAEWTGVPLAAVLERAGVRDGAVAVICEGADRGTVSGSHAPTGAFHFSRGLPLAAARQADVLLAYRINGRDLPPHHGFPLRLVVPGWYGMASVKWLQRLVLAERPFSGYFQSIAYTTFASVNGLPQLTPITRMLVKSLIAQPVAGAHLERNRRYRITGAAWSGAAEIRRVDVSTDGGRTWQAAQLQERSQASTWRLWEYPWQTPAQAGPVTLMARATDSLGHTQPLERDTNRGAYVINHVLPVRVEVQ